MSSFFIAFWLVLCGVWFWNQAEALALLEQEEERTERGMLVVGKAVDGVGSAGAETVERALSIILSISNPTKWFRCCRFDENLELCVVLGLTIVMLAIYRTSCLVD